MTTRRKFLKEASAGMGISALPGVWSIPCPCQGAPIPYDCTLRDRLWMWGHGAGTTKGLYNLPSGGKNQPSEAIDYIGIPNVCMIRWHGVPPPPFDEYVKQFAKTKRLAWSVVDGARQPYAEKKRMALELADKMPNLVSLYLDDFFRGKAVPKKEGDPAGAALSVSGIKALRKELDERSLHLDLSVVLYSHQLNPAITQHLAFCDVVAFWTWTAGDLINLQTNFETYRKIIPDKRTLLGIYMWDFGGKKPISIELMERQCQLGLQWLRERKIEGMIFHCTPLCDMKLEAVEWAKGWIARHADDVVC